MVMPNGATRPSTRPWLGQSRASAQSHRTAPGGQPRAVMVHTWRNRQPPASKACSPASGARGAGIRRITPAR
jgi:hypothetical protein